jgi:hypothetical protein
MGDADSSEPAVVLEVEDDRGEGSMKPASSIASSATESRTSEEPRLS